MARMLAAFLGILCLLNVFVDAVGGFNASIGWIELRLPYNIAREVPAWWLYYVRGL